MSAAKILPLEVVAERLAVLRAAGKKIVQCHGCFDLMHIGHIRHLQAAKRLGDRLVVTVTADHYVAKGDGRPVFGETLRAEALAALECVDFVAINRWPTAAEAIRLLRPEYYVKGQTCAIPSQRSERLRAEIAALHESGGEIRFTDEIVFSSTALMKTLPRG
ncbi:MAG TPA: adenylyltransferase/cytidyltransferase family protein [Candidatus Methylomirabilis sp.]|nr:adenylyltransferase/cytidyltransferase family protein [Candidatus Methylomirabilis sp.]